jgi:Flp pilus assembly pilin Flp
VLIRSSPGVIDARKRNEETKEVSHMKLIKRFIREEKGQGMAEYALILGLVVLGIWVAVATGGVGDAISGLFGNVASEIEGCTSGSCGG